MKFILNLIIFSFFSFLQASSSYPQLYSTQGTPLYKSANSVEKFKKFDSLKVETTNYIEKLNTTKKVGFKVDISGNKKDKMAYLKELRALQLQHDKVFQHSIKELYGFIKKGDYQNFLKITNIGMSYYSKKHILNENIISYYQQNRKEGKSKAIEEIIKRSKIKTIYYESSGSIVKQNNKKVEHKSSSKDIVLLSKPGCSYCVKTKKLLDSMGKSYQEYNIKESKGKELFNSYNGNGVPLLIIDEKVIRGFNSNAIKAALK